MTYLLVSFPSFHFRCLDFIPYFVFPILFPFLFFFLSSCIFFSFSPIKSVCLPLSIKTGDNIVATFSSRSFCLCARIPFSLFFFLRLSFFLLTFFAFPPFFSFHPSLYILFISLLFYGRSRLLGVHNDSNINNVLLPSTDKCKIEETVYLSLSLFLLHATSDMQAILRAFEISFRNIRYNSVSKIPSNWKREYFSTRVKSFIVIT